MRILYVVGIECSHDVRVMQTGGGLNLALKPGDSGFILQEIPAHQLEGHNPPQRRLPGPIHGPHPAVTQLVE